MYAQEFPPYTILHWILEAKIAVSETEMEMEKVTNAEAEAAQWEKCEKMFSPFSDRRGKCVFSINFYCPLCRSFKCERHGNHYGGNEYVKTRENGRKRL